MLSTWFANNSFTTSADLYASLVSVVQSFYDHYVLQINHTKSSARHSGEWVRDRRLRESEEEVTQAAAAYHSNRTFDTLHAYLTAARSSRDLKHTVKQEYWYDFLQHINTHTPVTRAWRFVNRVVQSHENTSPPLHHNPVEYATYLANKWSTQSQLTFLPAPTRARLLAASTNRLARIAEARTTPLFLDDHPITDEELRLALLQGRATAPGDDGITYSTLRLIAQVPGNPLLTLYNLSLSEGALPEEWTRSTILPIPKPDSSDIRPISLTSCLCKVLERILLARLRNLVQDQLSPHLYGFLPGRSTHHCLAELLSHLTSTSCVAFLDLKAAFDVANREVILDELVHLGVTGRLFCWIENYLSHRYSRVLYCGAVSDYLPFNLGTPQGGVLSPFLFNILMNKLLRSLEPTPTSSLLLSYADDICIHSHCPVTLQRLLTKFGQAASACGLIINTSRTKLFTQSLNHRYACKTITLLGSRLDVVHDYKYLGIPLSSLYNPAQYVTTLRTRLLHRLIFLSHPAHTG